MSEKPDCVQTKHLVYLDDLRERGTANMLDAATLLQGRFPSLTRKEARAILVYFMETFDERHSEEGNDE